VARAVRVASIRLPGISGIYGQAVEVLTAEEGGAFVRR